MQTGLMTEARPSTKKQAREVGSKFYFTGKACSNEHVSERRTTTGQCVECAKLVNRKWYEAHREDENARSRADYEGDREARISRAAQWAKDNPDRVREAQAQSRARDPEKFREKSRDFRRRKPEIARAAVTRWLKANPDRKNAHHASRRAAKLQASPPWLTASQRAEMEACYVDAAQRAQETGIEHHVDHIEPLRGRKSCGLHVPWNLQVLTWEENLKKGNRLLAE